MGKLSSYMPSKYLKKEDLGKREYTLTIREIAVEKMEQDGADKPVLYFTKGKKGLVLNKGNIAVLIDHFGDDEEIIKGKEVTLYVDPNVMYKGQRKGGLRLRIPESEQIGVVDDSPDAGAVDEPGFDDDSPFEPGDDDDPPI